MECKSTGPDLAARLAAVSDHVAQAALFGAQTAHRLAELAHAWMDEAGAAEAEGLADAVKRIQLLTVAANHAAELGMNLLKANKDLAGAEQAPTPVAIAFAVEDARRDANDSVFIEPAAG